MKNIIKRIIVGVFVSLIVFSVKSCNVNAAEFVDFNTLGPGTWQGYSPTNSGYVTLWNRTGMTGNFKYGSYPYLYVSGIFMSVINAQAGDTFNYILQVQVCQKTDDYSLRWDSNSAYSQVKKIEFIRYSNVSTCDINVYTGKLVNYYYVITGNLITYNNPESNVGFNGQKFYLRWTSNNYNEYKVTNVNYVNYTQQTYVTIAISNTQDEINTKLAQQVNQSQSDNEALRALIGSSITSANTNSEILKQAIGAVGNQNHLDHQENVNTIINSTNYISNTIGNGISSIISNDNPDSSLYNNLSNNNLNNGVINNLVALPITLIRAFSNGFNSSCTPYNFGNLYGHNLILPCINLSSYFGSLWNVIDIIISGVFVYTFGRKLVKIFNDVTNLKENQIDEVFN